MMTLKELNAKCLKERYEIKEGEREGTINGKTYKFKSIAKLDDEGDKK